MIMIGKNKDFKVVWYCELQTYSVWYKDKVIMANKYRYRDVESYLN